MEDLDKLIIGISEAKMRAGATGADCVSFHFEIVDMILKQLMEKGRQNTPVKPRLMRDWYVCECGASITMQVDGEPFRKSQYCCACGKPVDWS